MPCVLVWYLQMKETERCAFSTEKDARDHLRATLPERQKEGAAGAAIFDEHGKHIVICGPIRA